MEFMGNQPQVSQIWPRTFEQATNVANTVSAIQKQQIIENLSKKRNAFAINCYIPMYACTYVCMYVCMHVYE